MDFASLNYSQFAHRFKLFTDEELASLDRQNAINSIIAACREEIDVTVWGNLAIEGLLYLTASKIVDSMIVEMSMRQLGLEQAIAKQSSDRLSLPSTIQKVDVQGEYSVEYASKSGNSSDSFGSGFQSNLKTATSYNPYRQEYERLQRIVSDDLFIV